MAPPGWHTGSQIRTRALAASIINNHQHPTDAVLDPPSLALLPRFCAAPTPATRDAILAERGWVDEPGRAAGDKAAGEGDLVGFCVARHGTGDAVFDGRDLEMLRGWFERGMPGGERVVR